MPDTENQDFTSLTVDLLSAYFASNTIDSDQLSGLIRSTHDALAGLNTPDPIVEPTYEPAVSIRKSLSSPDHIVSLIDGKPYKTLKRHLGGHGLTPAEYRERYKLPRDYPMVAASYSEHRRDVAARLGLGRKPRTVPTDTVAAEPIVSGAFSTPKKAATGKAGMGKTVTAASAKAEAAPEAKPAKAKTARAPKAAPAAEAVPAAETPKTRAKRAPLKLNLSALKGSAEPASK